MSPHSIFLRSGCILPSRLYPRRWPISEDWTLVEEMPALVFATKIRQAGWPFVWVQEACSRIGFGRTEESSIQRCVVRALQGVSRRFNAAELDSLWGTRRPGFFFTHVKVRARQIQLSASLDPVKQLHPLGMRAPAMPDNALDKGNAPKGASPPGLYSASCTPCVNTESR